MGQMDIRCENTLKACTRGMFVLNCTITGVIETLMMLPNDTPAVTLSLIYKSPASIVDPRGSFYCDIFVKVLHLWPLVPLKKMVSHVGSKKWHGSRQLRK